MGGRPRILHKLINGVKHKQCFFCKDWFPLKLFGNDKKSWDGLRVDCKKCDSTKGRVYYANLTKEDKERRKKRIAAYNVTNKEKLKVQRIVLYRKKHGPKIGRRILHKLINGVEHKQCSKCKKWLPISNFCNHKKEWDGLRTSCKKCEAIARFKYYANNKKAIFARTKKWVLANPEKARKNARKDMAKILSTTKGRLRYKISISIGAALKGNKAGRHWEDLVGYTLDQLYRRLRRTLPASYTWQDYLDGKLHIDHKIPISVFNFEKPEDEDFQKCFALKNLQLLPALENIIKSNKLDKHFQPSFKF